MTSASLSRRRRIIATRRFSNARAANQTLKVTKVTDESPTGLGDSGSSIHRPESLLKRLGRSGRESMA